MKVLIGGAIMTLLAACGPGGNSFRIRGSFRDMQAGELYIYNLSGDNARLDTLTIQGGKFRYRGETDEVTPFMLVFPNGVEQVIFAGPVSYTHRTLPTDVYKRQLQVLATTSSMRQQPTT